MSDPSITSVAVVGTGVIGRSWIRVFTRAGCETRVFDPDVDQLDRALAWARASAEEDERLGFIGPRQAEAEASRIVRSSTLADALGGVGWVQESGPEAIEAKQAIYAALDAAAEPDVILASSTSTHDVTVISNGLGGASRCIVAHPVNPPHVIPVVELLGGTATAPEVVARARTFLESVGQSPVEMSRYLSGFLLNRLQAALVREAVSLVESGAATADAIDAVVRDGLGLRWALMGPFGTAHTNADGGAAAYFRRYGSAYRTLWSDLEPEPDLSEEVLRLIQEGAEEMYGSDSVPTLSEWRDRAVRRIRMFKEEDPPPTPAG